MRFIPLVLCLIVASGQAAAHDWYSETSDPVSGLPCCGGSECTAIPEAELKQSKAGYVYLPTGELIPRTRVQYSRDQRFHRCVYKSDFFNLDLAQSFRRGETRCFFAPDLSM